MKRSRKLAALAGAAALAASVAVSAATATAASGPAELPFVLGLTTTPNQTVVAATAAGLMSPDGATVAATPPLSDVAAIGAGEFAALTGGGTDPGSATLWRVSKGGQRKAIADLGVFEAANNPDGGEIDSNPFGVAVVKGNQYLVADAGGNYLARVDNAGRVEVVATFPKEALANPFYDPDHPELGPSVIMADAVPTSVVVGPDGAYYVGELKGFPATPGHSRIWRIEKGTVGAACGQPGNGCTLVGSGFTSITDLALSADGKLLVAEMDEASFIAYPDPELPPLPNGPTPQGGTIDSCVFNTTVCTVLAHVGGPVTAVTATKSQVWAAIGFSTVVPVA